MSKNGWVTGAVVRIILTQVVFGFGWSLYLLTPSFLTTQLHAEPEAIGRVVAMGGLTGLLTVPFAAIGLDRLERRLFFQIGALLIVLLSVGYGYVERVSPLVYLLQGCLSAAFVLAFNSTAALLSDYAPPERLGQAIGWLGGANVAMNAVATMVAEPLAAAYGWRAVFRLGIAVGASAFVLSFGLRAAPAHAHAAATELPAYSPPRISQLAPLLAATSLMGAVFIAVFGFVQPYAIGLGAREVRTFFVGYTLAAVGCRLVLGGVGDRMGRRGLSIGLLGGYALAALVMRELHVELLMVYGLWFGAVHGLLYPTLNALLLELLPPNRRGLGMVLYNGAFNLGSSCGSFAWGAIAQQHGYSPVYTLAALGAVGAAALLYKRPHMLGLAAFAVSTHWT